MRSLFIGLTSVALLLAEVFATPTFNKVMTIPLGAAGPTGKSTLAFGLQDMYYTTQANGTVVAVNLTSGTIAFSLKFPGLGGGEGSRLFASRSGYLGVVGTDMSSTIFDPSGNFVCDTTHSVSERRPHGEDGVMYLDNGVPTHFNLKTCDKTIVPMDLSLQQCQWSRGTLVHADTNLICSNVSSQATVKYNYATREVHWQIFNFARYVGEGPTHVWITNTTGQNFQEVLVALDKRRPGLPATLQLKNLQMIGGGPQWSIPPTLSGDEQLVSVIHGMSYSTLSLINVSNSVVVTQVGLAPAPSGNRVMEVIDSSKLVCWTEDFKLLAYPGVRPVFPVVRGANSSPPLALQVLGSTGLVLGVWSNKTVIRDIKNGGAVVFERPVEVPRHATGAASHFVDADKKRLVLTNGDSVEVYGW